MYYKLFVINHEKKLVENDFFSKYFYLPVYLNLRTENWSFTKYNLKYIWEEVCSYLEHHLLAHMSPKCRKGDKILGKKMMKV